MTQEFLRHCDLDRVYGDYPVDTDDSLSNKVRRERLEFDCTHALTSLPGWSRVLQDFSHATAVRAPAADGHRIEPGRSVRRSKRQYLDVKADCAFAWCFSVFANLRKLSDATGDQEVAGPSSPPPARFLQCEDFGTRRTVGARGAF